MVKLVIFDYSGTLVNDLRESWQAISKIVELYGKKSDTLEQFRWNWKLPYWDYLIEKKGFTPEEAYDERIPKLYIEFYKELIDRVTPFSDVKETILELAAKSIKLAIVSQTPRDLISNVMGKYDLSRYFDDRLVLGFHDYKKQKPCPESILLVLNELGLNGSEAVYVGDMREDIIAAKRAGVIPAAIYREEGSYHPRAYLEKENPAIMITDLRELLKIW